MGKPGFPTPCARAAPSPSRGRRDGETRFPHPPAQGLRPHLPAGGGMGKPGFPTPLRKGCALPNPPAGGGMGKPGFPTPCARAAPSQTLPRAEGWGNPVSPYPCSRARPSRGRRDGETRFPHPPAQGLRPHLPAGGGMGEPGSPMFTLEPHAAAPHTKRNENQIFLGGRSPPKPSRRGGIFTFEECNLESEEELCATSAPR